MLNAREDAASVVMPRDSRMYVMGGFLGGSSNGDKMMTRKTEVLNAIDGTWEESFALPEGTMSIDIPLAQSVYFYMSILLVFSKY